MRIGDVLAGNGAVPSERRDSFVSRKALSGPVKTLEKERFRRGVGMERDMMDIFVAVGFQGKSWRTRSCRLNLDTVAILKRRRLKTEYFISLRYNNIRDYSLPGTSGLVVE